jgi:hypothetical protein
MVDSKDILQMTGGIKVIAVVWDQDERKDDTTPYYWRVTFTFKLTNGWGITHALEAVEKCIKRGEAGNSYWRMRLDKWGANKPDDIPFDPNGGVQ